MMKEELQLKLVEILTQIQSAVSTGASFAMEQLPDIAQQYVLYARVESTFYSLIWMIISILSAYYGYKAWASPWMKEGYHSKIIADSCDFLRGFLPFISALTFIISILCFNFLVWFAPKVWLLKEIAKLIK